MPVNDRIQLRRGTEAQWIAAEAADVDVEPLGNGEPGLVVDADGVPLYLVIGDTGTEFGDLPRFSPTEALTGTFEALEIDRVSIPGYGLEITPSEFVTSNMDLSSQRVYFVRFTVDRRITIKGVSFASDSTAAAATPTTVRMGLYAISEDHQYWAMARTANTPSMFSATMTIYGPDFDTSWASSVTLVPGRAYAAAVLVDTATTVPKASASAAVRTSLQSTSALKAVRSGVATELPGSINQAGVASLTNVPWARANPGGTENTARTAVLLGDSFFASYESWFGLGNAQGDARLHPIKNSGVSSETLAQMITRWTASVAAYSPEWVVLHGGTNDIFAEGATAATVIARYQAIIALAQAAGYSLLICVPPSNAAGSAGAKTILGTVRVWLLALSEPGVVVADTGMALTTGDGVTADAAKLVDAVHPNATGLQAMADVVDGIVAAIA